MPRFRKKPVEIEAMQMPRANDQGAVRKVAEWMADHGYEDDGMPNLEDCDPEYVYGDKVLPEFGSNYLQIETLEGEMTASPGDWIIQGVEGEFYPCKPSVFDATYEPAV